MKRFIPIFLLLASFASHAQQAHLKAAPPLWMQNPAWLPWQSATPLLAWKASLPYSMPSLQEQECTWASGNAYGAGAGSAGMEGWRRSYIHFMGGWKVSHASLGIKIRTEQLRIEALGLSRTFLSATIGAIVPLTASLKLDALAWGIPLGKAGPGLLPEAKVLLHAHANRLIIRAGGAIRGYQAMGAFASCQYSPREDLCLIGEMQTAPMQLGIGAGFFRNPLGLQIMLRHHSILGISPSITATYAIKKVKTAQSGKLKQSIAQAEK